MLNHSIGMQSAKSKLWETLSSTSAKKPQGGEKETRRGCPKIERDMKDILTNYSLWISVGSSYKLLKKIMTVMR